MNSPTLTAETLVHYEGGPRNLETRVVRALEESFQLILSNRRDDLTPPLPGDPEEIADRISRIILNFSRAKDAGMPNDQVDPLRTRILQFVKRGIPVEAQMLCSPKKHWKLGDVSGIDLAELAAFQTLFSIDAAVRPVYRPGMSFVLDVEDIEFQFMEGRQQEVIDSQNLYACGMKRLISVLDLGELFNLRRMSERAKDAVELRRWQEQMTKNYEALKTYWHESEESPVPSWEALPSFRELRQLGWKGTIPPEMRRYYMKRLGRLTGPSDGDKADMILRNLAGILLHYQAGLLGGSGKVKPIKLSFVRSSDGAPSELLQGRVDLRFAARKLCSRVSAAAPWATKGFVYADENRLCVSFRGWHELDRAHSRFSEGSLTISRHDVSARVRADFLQG